MVLLDHFKDQTRITYVGEAQVSTLTGRVDLGILANVDTSRRQALSTGSVVGGSIWRKDVSQAGISATYTKSSTTEHSSICLGCISDLEASTDVGVSAEGAIGSDIGITGSSGMLSDHLLDMFLGSRQRRARDLDGNRRDSIRASGSDLWAEGGGGS